MVQRYYLNNKILRQYRKKQSERQKRLLVIYFETGVIVCLIFVFASLIQSFSNKRIVSPIVLAEANNAPTPTQILIPTLAPTFLPAKPLVLSASSQINSFDTVPKKLTYKIAILGDSMVDTMGERLEYLEHNLKAKYPDTEFLLYNYGIGARNVVEALGQIYNEFNNRDRHFPPLAVLQPDILIVGSFAYNPFFPHDRNKHWLGLAALIQEAKKVAPKVYILAEIAPLKRDFGKGPNGVNWDNDTVYIHATHIIEQLENAVGLSKSLGVPLIDVFAVSQTNEEKEGSWRYVNPSDGIHPSVAGHELTAEIISKTISLD